MTNKEVSSSGRSYPVIVFPIYSSILEINNEEFQDTCPKIPVNILMLGTVQVIKVLN